MLIRVIRGFNRLLHVTLFVLFDDTCFDRLSNRSLKRPWRNSGGEIQGCWAKGSLPFFVREGRGEGLETALPHSPYTSYISPLRGFEFYVIISANTVHRSAVFLSHIFKIVRSAPSQFRMTKLVS